MRAPLQKSVKELQKVGGTHKIFFEISSVKRSFVGKKKNQWASRDGKPRRVKFRSLQLKFGASVLVDTVIRKINRWKVKDWPCEVSIFQEPL